jgi:hypothetical protein
VAHRISRKKPGDLKFLHNLLFGRKGKVKSLTQEKPPLDLPDAKFVDYLLPKNLVVPKPAVYAICMETATLNFLISASPSTRLST